MENVVQEIMSDLIDEPKAAMRTDIDRDELHKLAESIQANGLINPITVRPVGERYEIVAGHRRFLACRIAGKIRIPCVVRVLTDAEYFSIMTAENLERGDVDPVDEAIHIKRHMDATGISITDMAAAIKRGEKYVEDRLTIGEMPEYMQAFLKSGQLKIGVALALAKIEPEEKRAIWVELAVRDGISVRTADYWLYQHNIGLLPDGKPSEGGGPDAPANEYRPIMFKCALDGKEYPVTDTQAVTIYKGNLHLLGEFQRALNSESAPS